MYKNLSGDGLGVSARQNEKVELALTYGFKGIDIDLAEMVSRIPTFGEDFARRYIVSAQKKAGLIAGTFKLPISLAGTDSEFASRLPKLEQGSEMAQSIGATRCVFDVPCGSNKLAYHENFELYRARLTSIAEVLGKNDIHLGLSLIAAPDLRANYEYQFVFEAEPLLTLIRTLGRDNVGLALDLWNWTVGDGGLDQIEELDVSQIVAVRISDVPEDIDLGSVSYKQRLLPGTTESSRAVKVLKILHDKGYAGPVAAAPHSSQFSGLTRDAVVQKTSESLDRVLERAGVIKPAVPPAAVAAAAPAPAAPAASTSTASTASTSTPAPSSAE